MIRALYENFHQATTGGRKNDGELLFLLHAVLLLCRAKKSRLVDSAVLVFMRELEDCPRIPGVALDLHTSRGRRMGRGWTHFFAEGTKLVPETEIDDIYLEEAKAAIRRQPKVDWTMDTDNGQTTMDVD